MRPAPARAKRPAPARPGSTDGWVLAGLVLLALLLRLPGLAAGLPEVYEEAYPFKTAWRMWGWGPGRELDLNPHWFKYPGLTIYLQFLGQGVLYLLLSATGAVRGTLDFRILHELDPTAFYQMGRGITALLGAATAIPVFLLARQLAGRGAAVIAAALVALSPPLVAKSQVIEVDVPLTFLVAAGLLAAVRLAGGATRRRVVAAGMLAGLATTAKYPGLVLLVPCLVALVLAARSARPAGPARPRRRAGSVPGWPVAVLLLGGAWLATVFVTSPYLFLDHRAALADLAVEREHMRLGHFGTGLGPTWMSYLRAWFTSVAGGTVSLAALAGLVLMGAVRRLPWALVAGSFVLAYALLVSSFAMKADRYLLPLLPAGIVFACVVAAEASGRLAGRGRSAARDTARPDRAAGGRERPRGPRAGLALAAAGLVLALPAVPGLVGHFRTLRPDTRTQAKAWFEASVPPGSFVAMEQYGPPLLSPLGLQAIDRDLLPALQERGYQPRLYAVVSVPLFQVSPERSAAFYDPALYRVADAFVVTGSVRDRHRQEPARFAAQLAFYDTLAASWEVWREFPSNGGAGPAITVYRNPSHAEPFAARRPAPDPPPRLAEGPATGGEAYFHYNLGLNYELFGFVGAALPAYLEGLRFAASDPASATACAERAAGVLVRVGRADDAVRLLDQAVPGAVRPADAERLRALRGSILAGSRSQRDPDS